MDFQDVIFKRISIRKFRDEDISDEKLDKIIQSALLAPTSRNRNPCKFIVVKNKEILAQLSEVKETGSKFLKNANIGIAVFANEDVADTWIEDSSIALTFIQLAAVNLDVGSCWVQLRLREDSNHNDAEQNARNILNIDENYRIVGIMALGVSDITREGKTIDDLDYDKITFIE